MEESRFIFQEKPGYFSFYENRGILKAKDRFAALDAGNRIRDDENGI